MFKLKYFFLTIFNKLFKVYSLVRIPKFDVYKVLLSLMFFSESKTLLSINLVHLNDIIIRFEYVMFITNEFNHVILSVTLFQM